MNLLVEVTAQTAGAAAQVHGSGQLDVGALDLDEEVEALDLHDDAVASVGVDDGLDGLFTGFTDLETGLLIHGLVRGLGTVDGDVTGRVQLDGVLAVDDSDDLVSIVSLVGGDGDLGLFVAIGQQDMGAIADGVVVESAIEGVDSLVTDVAPGLGNGSGSDVDGIANKVATSAQWVEDLGVGVGQRRETLPFGETETDIVSNQSFHGADESHVAGSGERITLDDPASAVRSVRLSLGVLDGEGVEFVIEPLTERIGPVSHGLGQVLGLGGHFVVVVSLIHLTGFSASGAAVHESGGHILLALLSSRAVHGGLGGSFVAEDLGFEDDLRLVAMLTETDGVFFSHVQDILAETVSRRLVPVADGPVTDVVVDLPVGADVGSSGSIFLDLDVGEILGVPGILGQAHGGVEVDESAILLFGGETSPHQMSVAALDVLENTLNNWAEFSGDGGVGDNLGLGRSPGFVASSLENDRVLAGLGGVLVLEEGRNGAGAGAGRLVADGVFAVADFQRNEAEVGDGVNVPFLEPLGPGPFVGKVDFGLLDVLDVDTEALAQREFAVDGFLVDVDDVDLGVLKSGLGTVGPVTGDGVGLDVVVEEIGGLATGSPGDLDLARSLVVEGEILGGAGIDADVNSGGDVIAVEGDLDADLGGELPAQLGGDVGLDSSLAVTLQGSLHGDEDGQSGQEAHGKTQFGGEADVVLGQHAVLGDADFVGHVLVLHGLGQESGNRFFEFLQIDETVDGSHQVDVQESSAFVSRAGSSVQLIPDALQVADALVRPAGRLVLGGHASVEFAEDVLPDISHVVVPHVDLLNTISYWSLFDWSLR